MSYIDYDDDDFDPEELYCYDEDGDECPNCGEEPNPNLILEDGNAYCDECYEGQKSWG